MIKSFGILKIQEGIFIEVRLFTNNIILDGLQLFFFLSKSHLEPGCSAITNAKEQCGSGQVRKRARQDKNGMAQ